MQLSVDMCQKLLDIVKIILANIVSIFCIFIQLNLKEKPLILLMESEYQCFYMVR